MLGPPLLIGDHVAYSCDSGAFLSGTVRWMGRVAPLYGHQMVVGVELVIAYQINVTLSTKWLNNQSGYSTCNLSKHEPWPSCSKLLVRFLGHILGMPSELSMRVEVQLCSNRHV